MMRSVDEQERNFVARHYAVLLYEASEDLPQMFGGEYRKALSTLQLGEQILAELDGVMKRINEFKRLRAAKLKSVRIHAGAHREHDTTLQLEMIESIQPISMMELAAEIYAPIRALLDLLTKVTIRSADLAVLMRDAAQLT